jgi:cell division protein FtsB
VDHDTTIHPQTLKKFLRLGLILGAIAITLAVGCEWASWLAPFAVLFFVCSFFLLGIPGLEYGMAWVDRDESRAERSERALVQEKQRLEAERRELVAAVMADLPPEMREAVEESARRVVT